MGARRRTVISGVGVVTAAGAGVDALAAALAKGVLLAKPVSAFEAGTFPTPNACEVPGLDPKALARSPKDAKILARSAVLALGALADLKASAPGRWFGDPWTAGLFLGVGMEQGDHRDVLDMLAASREGGKLILDRLASQGMDAMNPLSSLKTLPNMSLAHIGIKLGDDAPRGPNAAYSPFDAASLEALGAAAEAVACGECEAALAGGVDAPVSLFGMTTFYRLGVARADRPLGEAAALFLIETPERAREAGRLVLAEIVGVGSASDANAAGLSSSRSVSAATKEALARAGESPSRIEEVLASAGDDALDAETLGLGRVPLTAIRAVFGETAAAGGALAIAAALARIRGGRSRVLAIAGAYGGAAGAVVLRSAA